MNASLAPRGSRTPLDARCLAPAVFLGMQDCGGLRPDFALYNLTADIPGHPRGSTVAADTLRELGYAMPATRAAEGRGEGARNEAAA